MSKVTTSAPEFVLEYLKKQDEEFNLDATVPSLAQFDKIMTGRKAQIAAYYASKDKSNETSKENPIPATNTLSLSPAIDLQVPGEGQDDSEEPLPKYTQAQIQQLIYARYEARDKEMQTKEGRAKWEKFEKDTGCVGSFAAFKEAMIARAVNEKLDVDALLPLAEEARKQAESEAAATAATTGGKKGGKGKKKA